MRLLVTGGCGFIGSNFVRYVLTQRADMQVVVYDALTYAGNLESLSDVIEHPGFRFVKGDIADRDAVRSTLEDCDAVVNFAAQTHVDRSIMDAAPFIHANIVGTHTLLEAAFELGTARFVQISTDEVYGSLGPEGLFTEETPLAPTSPYSASKASADLLVRAFVQTHGLPALVLRPSNAYGPYQFPEKLIPLMILNALQGTPLPVYGDGQHSRDWVHVLDLCDAVLRILERGRQGEVYNVGGAHDIPNLSVVRQIVELTGSSESLIRFVDDRPGHDRRYATDHAKISRDLGWEPIRRFDDGLRETVSWYVEHSEWIDSVQTGEYRDYYHQQYGSRLSSTQS
jgi:dTDP-glucose 4,6-dehydratase